MHQPFSPQKPKNVNYWKPICYLCHMVIGVIFRHQRNIDALIVEMQGLCDRLILFDDHSKDRKCYKQFDEVYRSDSHLGKQGFYRLWQTFMNFASEQPTCAKYIIVQDDFTDLRSQRIQQAIDWLPLRPTLVHLLNDGRVSQWNGKRPGPITDCPFGKALRVYFTEPHFICNQAALEAYQYTIESVPLSRFRHPGISSGVGEQLTMRGIKVEMYRPIESLCYHGSHPSLMHPTERIKHPLTSK